MTKLSDDLNSLAADVEHSIAISPARIRSLSARVEGLEHQLSHSLFARTPHAEPTRAPVSTSGVTPENDPYGTPTPAPTPGPIDRPRCALQNPFNTDEQDLCTMYSGHQDNGWHGDGSKVWHEMGPRSSYDGPYPQQTSTILRMMGIDEEEMPDADKDKKGDRAVTHCKVVGATYDSDQPTWHFTVARAQDEVFLDGWPEPADIPQDVREALQAWLARADPDIAPDPRERTMRAVFDETEEYVEPPAQTP